MDETTVMMIYENKNHDYPTRVLAIDDIELARAWVHWCQDTGVRWRTLMADRMVDIPPAVEKQQKLF